jgi:hypothetical protein
VDGLRERLADLSQRQGLGESDEDNEVHCHNTNAPLEALFLSLLATIQRACNL